LDVSQKGMISFSDEDQALCCELAEYRRIMRLGWLTGLGFLVVLLLDMGILLGRLTAVLEEMVDSMAEALEESKCRIRRCT
jgi:hypothetical protein